MRTGNALAAVALTGAMVLFTAPTAHAHAELKSTDPAANATLSAAPTTVTLTFDDEVTLPNDAITITGPGGATWTVGTPRTDGAVVTAPVRANGPAGSYAMTWRVRADDGDIVNGTVPFTLTAPAGNATTATSAPAAAAPANLTSGNASPAPASEASPAQDAGSGGLPVWVWVLIVVVVVLLGAVAAARRRSSGRT